MGVNVSIKILQNFKENIFTGDIETHDDSAGADYLRTNIFSGKKIKSWNAKYFKILSGWVTKVYTRNKYFFETKVG